MSEKMEGNNITSAEGVGVNENSVESSSSAPTGGLFTIEADTLDPDTLKSLKGDCIGDTMFSESFLVGTLLKLNDISWNNELEDDLCLVWDMSVEKDISEYLFNINYPSIACSVILNHMDNVRLIEIVIGILGNMLCVKCDPSISDVEIQVILTTLNSSDAMILVQTMRFLRGICHKLDKYKFIDDIVVSKVAFILRNSLKKILLEETLEFATYIHAHKVDISCISDDFLLNVFRATQILMPSKEDIDMEHQRILKLVFRILSNFADYYEARFSDCISEETLKKFSVMMLRCSTHIEAVCRKVIKFFGESINLCPIPEGAEVYYSAITNLCHNKLYEYNRNDFICMLRTVELLTQSKYTSEAYNEITECFILPVYEWTSQVPIEQLKNDLVGVEDVHVKSCLTYITNRLGNWEECDALLKSLEDIK